MILINLLLTAQAQEIKLLPGKNLFNPPIADPRWPKFLMGISRDAHNRLGKSIWSFNFGENIGLIRFGSSEKPYEIGVQAATFGAMDIHSKPTTLLNTDYFVGLGLSHRHDNFQHLFQLSHTSSHIGDELLLSPRGQNIKRINLSYEAVKWFLRYKDTASSFSPYLQLGYIINIEPNKIKRFNIAGGIDYFSNKFSFVDTARFIAGGFINSWEENKFTPTINFRFGLQFEHTEYYGRYLQLLIEYQRGQSQHGQFYRIKTNHIGLLVTFSS